MIEQVIMTKAEYKELANKIKELQEENASLKQTVKVYASQVIMNNEWVEKVPLEKRIKKLMEKRCKHCRGDCLEFLTMKDYKGRFDNTLYTAVKCDDGGYEIIECPDFVWD